MKDFKVRCKWSKDRCFTKGKVYEYINGEIKADLGYLIGKGWSNWNSVKEFNNWCGNKAKFELVTEPQQFTKDMLKTGMRVKFRNGEISVVLKDVETTFYGTQELFFAKNHIFNIGQYLDNNLNDMAHGGYSIVEVYEKLNESEILDVTKLGKLLWQRPEIPKMTHKELESIVGHEFEYVKE